MEMGDPKKTVKHYEKPMRLWDKENLEKERIMKNTYGLQNKRELWRSKTILSKKRKTARLLLAMQPEERAKREQELLNSLIRLGLMDEKASLDDILTLTTEAILERRLQTVVWRKGLANTAKQARQFITHGHIAINGKKVTAPGYLVPAEEEAKIAYYGKKMELKPAEKKKPAAKPVEAGEKPAEKKKEQLPKEEKGKAKMPEEKEGPRRKEIGRGAAGEKKEENQKGGKKAGSKEKEEAVKKEKKEEAVEKMGKEKKAGTGEKKEEAGKKGGAING